MNRCTLRSPHKESMLGIRRKGCARAVETPQSKSFRLIGRMAKRELAGANKKSNKTRPRRKPIKSQPGANVHSKFIRVGVSSTTSEYC